MDEFCLAGMVMNSANTVGQKGGGMAWAQRPNRSLLLWTIKMSCMMIMIDSFIYSYSFKELRQNAK